MLRHFGAFLCSLDPYTLVLGGAGKGVLVSDSGRVSPVTGQCVRPDDGPDKCKCKCKCKTDNFKASSCILYFMLSYCDILFFCLIIQLLAARLFNKPRSFVHSFVSGTGYYYRAFYLFFENNTKNIINHK